MYQILSNKNVSLHDLYKTTLSIGNLCLFRWTWWLLAGGFYRLPISIFMVWNSRSVYPKVFCVEEFPRKPRLLQKVSLVLWMSPVLFTLSKDILKRNSTLQCPTGESRVIQQSLQGFPMKSSKNCRITLVSS